MGTLNIEVLWYTVSHKLRTRPEHFPKQGGTYHNVVHSHLQNNTMKGTFYVNDRHAH